MKVLHIITGLNQGGAEGALYRLVQATSDRVSHEVVSLLDEGRYGARLKDEGTPVSVLNMRRGWMTPMGLWHLRRAIATARPDVIQTWMYHADLVGGLMALTAGSPPVIWGIRHSNLHPLHSQLSTRVVMRTCALTSRLLPSAVTSCSRQAMHLHQELGYKTRDARVIPNGFDLDRFKPDPVARLRLRNALRVGPQEVLLGALTRWDLQKDHATFFEAVGMVKRRGIPVRCLVAGNEVTTDNAELANLIRLNGLADEAIVLGPRSDVPDLMNALDLHVTSSAYGEAFPNVIAEAMACGTPCVSTNVGDASYIIGSTGWLVPPERPRQLADAIASAVSMMQTPAAKSLIADRCRRRIAENFSLTTMSEGFMDLWTMAVAAREPA